MKILYVGAFRFPKYDAAASRVLNNARALRECGHEVEFISWGGRYEDKSKQLGDTDVYDGFNYSITGELDRTGCLLSRLINRFSRGSRTLDLIRGQKHQPDLVVSYNPALFFNLRLIRYTSWNKIKYANDITEWSDKNELRLIERITNYINLRFTTHRIRNRIVISQYLYNYYQSGNNIIVPPLCSLKDIKWFSLGDDSTKDNEITFIYAGNPAKKDCLHVVINSIQEKITDGYSFRLLVVGIGKSEFIRKYANFLKTKNLSDNIVFIGKVSQDVVPSYYHKSDFMVLLREPNRKSMAGFPTKFVESFAAGIPVVANITSDLADYLDDGKTGFIVRDNSEVSLEDTLDIIAHLSREEIDRMKDNVREVAIRFDYHFYVNSFRRFISLTQ